MTSWRQFQANRLNALKSAGPRTEEGKRVSRRNALRHGLTAETVIDALEDTEDYRAFEAMIISDYDAQTAVERELVLRLASLLWHLRRIISIETDLFQIQAELLRDRRNALGPATNETQDQASEDMPLTERVGDDNVIFVASRGWPGPNNSPAKIGVIMPPAEPKVPCSTTAGTRARVPACDAATPCRFADRAAPRSPPARSERTAVGRPLIGSPISSLPEFSWSATTSQSLADLQFLPPSGEP
jgi:hypothetical protein